MATAAGKAKKILKEYGVKECMKEIEEACEFAKFTKNATALANLLQLKAKINGLIIDKMDHRIAGSFQINISGINASREVGPQQIAGGQSESRDNNQLQPIGSGDKELP